jgi:secondary thiamine-phosphate synthase enzyme
MPSTFEIHTQRKSEMVDITAKVAAAVRSAGVDNGVAWVFCPHTTAGITLQENADPAVQLDFLLALENAVPDKPREGIYRHAEGNSPAHVKASLVGASQAIPVVEGKLALGTWQAMYLCEFDGPRHRRVSVTVVVG